MRGVRTAVWVLLTVGVVASVHAQERNGPPKLTRDEEIALALSAAPPEVSEKATVYVLESKGYVQAREGSNGFTCLITRSLPGSLEPACYDAEASRYFVPRNLRNAELRAQGKTPAELRQVDADEFRAGKLRPPRRGGIIYMLSKENWVPDPSGKIIWYPPHLMFYVPYLTNADIGAKLAMDAPVFVIFEGTPDAMIIVPVDGHEHQ